MVARPIAQDHSYKREILLREAAELFAKEGYGRASMADIARACGISKANIYHYYQSKEALLFDMLERHLKFLLDRVQNLKFPDKNPREKLRFLMMEILLAYEGADAEHDVLLTATLALPKEKQDILRQYQLDFLGVGRKILEELAPEKIAQDHSKMRALTMSIFGMLNWHYKWCKNADASTRKVHADLIAQLTLDGIGEVS